MSSALQAWGRRFESYRTHTRLTATYDADCRWFFLWSVSFTYCIAKAKADIMLVAQAI